MSRWNFWYMKNIYHAVLSKGEKDRHYYLENE